MPNGLYYFCYKKIKRFDFNGTYGNVHGKIMTKISDALKNHVIY